MKILVAREAGFCMGVRRALELVVKQAGNAESGVVTWGPLIHNPQVVNLLETHGITSGREIGDLKPGRTVFISAHGISPAVREKLKATGARVCDASCPDVVKVQAVIKKYAARGYHTVIFGDAGHTEVEGLLGYTEGRGFVVGAPEEIEGLPPLGKVLLVSQTTRPQAEYDRVAERARARFRETAVAQTICASTRNRQAELARMLEKVDALVVVGGKNSANTARLSAIARQRQLPTFQVETAEELPVDELGGFRVVGVTAGASTPNWLIQGVVESLKEYGLRKTFFPIRWFFRLTRLLVKSNALVALGAAGLAVFTQATLGLPFSWKDPVFAYLATQAIYTINIFADPKVLSINAPYRSRFYYRHQAFLLGLAAVETVAGLLVAFSLGRAPFLMAIIVLVAGLFYIFPLIPGRVKRLKDSPQFRELTSSLGWVCVTAVFPLLASPRVESLSALPLVLLFAFVISLVRSILFGVRDLQGDRLLGRGTLPVLLGRGRSKVLICSLLAALVAATLIWAPGMGRASRPLLSIYAVTAYVLGYLALYHRRIVYEGLLQEIIVDGQFILAGLLAAALRLSEPGGW